MLPSLLARAFCFLSCAVVACVAQSAIGAAQTPPAATSSAPDPVRRLLDEGQALLRAREFEKAIAPIYAAIEELRRRGREATPDMGVANLLLARALAGLDHAQANDAYIGAVNLLAGSRDLRLYSEAASELLTRFENQFRVNDGDVLITAWLERVHTPGVPEGVRANAIERAEGYFVRSERRDDAFQVLAKALALEATTPEGAFLRGRALINRAIASDNAGRRTEALKDLEDAISDLRRIRDSDFAYLRDPISDMRRAAQPVLGYLGVALHTRGYLLFQSGLYENAQYGPALPLLEEAEPMLRALKPESLAQNILTRMHLLEFLERPDEALALARRYLESMLAQHGEGSREVRVARLKLVRAWVLAGADDKDDAAKLILAEHDAHEAEARTALQAGPPGLWRDPELTAMHLVNVVTAILRAAQVEDRRAGRSQFNDGIFRDVVETTELALSILHDAMPDVPMAMVELMRLRAEASHGLGDPNYTEQAYSRLIAQSQLAYGDFHAELAQDLDRYAAYLTSLGRHAEAEPIFRRSLAILKKSYGDHGIRFAKGLHNLAVSVSNLGHSEVAAEVFRQVLEVVPDSDTTRAFKVLAQVNLARALERSGRPEDALSAADGAAVDLVYEFLQGRAHQNLSFLNEAVRMLALAQLGRSSEAQKAGRAALGDSDAFRTLDDLGTFQPRTDEEASTFVVVLATLAEIAAIDDQHVVSLKRARFARELEQKFGLSDRRNQRILAEILVTATLNVAGN